MGFRRLLRGLGAQMQLHALAAHGRTTTIPNMASGMGRRAAFLVTVLLVVSCSVAIWMLVERPLARRPNVAGREHRAAFAIRDYVIPFQQWGTRAFTVPNLEAAYGRVEYMTQREWREDLSEEFARRLGALLETHEAVDLFLLAHSNPFVDWVAKVPPRLRTRLRLVYNTGCYDLKQKDAWLGLGARAYVGHVGSSDSPVFYVYFLRRWLRGSTLHEVVAESNARTTSVLTFLADAKEHIAQTHAELAGFGEITITGSAR